MWRWIRRACEIFVMKLHHPNILGLLSIVSLNLIVYLWAHSIIFFHVHWQSIFTPLFLDQSGHYANSCGAIVKQELYICPYPCPYIGLHFCFDLCSYPHVGFSSNSTSKSLPTLASIPVSTHFHVLEAFPRSLLVSICALTFYSIVHNPCHTHPMFMNHHLGITLARILIYIYYNLAFWHFSPFTHPTSWHDTWGNVFFKFFVKWGSLHFCLRGIPLHELIFSMLITKFPCSKFQAITHNLTYLIIPHHLLICRKQCTTLWRQCFHSLVSILLSILSILWF